MSSDSDAIPIRVIVLGGPKGVEWAVQLGRAELLGPSDTASDRVTFDFVVRMDPRRTDVRRFSGPAVQGKTGEQFVYVNSGQRAGQTASCWDRRAKVSLMSISPAMLAQLRRQGGALQAQISGVARDGGPACASIPLLEGGWQLVRVGVPS